MIINENKNQVEKYNLFINSSIYRLYFYKPAINYAEHKKTDK